MKNQKRIVKCRVHYSLRGSIPYSYQILLIIDDISSIASRSGILLFKVSMQLVNDCGSRVTVSGDIIRGGGYKCQAS